VFCHCHARAAGGDYDVWAVHRGAAPPALFLAIEFNNPGAIDL
jgi:hypothetical protein